MTDQPLAQGMMRDLQGNVVPIPQGAQQEPISQPQAAQSPDDGMMTDLQGNRVPIPKDATQEPIDNSVGSKMTGISAHTPTLWERAKNVVTEGIPQFSSRTVNNPKYGQEQFLSPEEAMTPMEQSAHPILTGTLEMTGGLSSPENITLMAATGGLGQISGPEAKLAARVIPRLASGVFSFQQVWGAIKESPQLWDAIKRGDESESLRLATHLIEGTAMAAMGAQHAAGVEATPSTTIGETLQRPVDRAVNTAATRLGQAFRSDANAMATANASLRAAEIIKAQRLNEVDHMNDQARRASEAYNNAKVRFANGEISAKELDDAATTASGAAANAGKAIKALNEADEARSQAAVEVDRQQRKSQVTSSKMTARKTRDIIGAKEDYKKVVPPSQRNALNFDRDYDIGRGYLENHHKNIEAIDTTQGLYDALDHAQKQIEQSVAPYREKYAKEPIQTNVRMDVRDELEKNPDTSFVQRGMEALEPYNLIDPTIEEAEAIRKQLNSAVRDKLAQPGMSVQTALDTDPVFAAKHAALDSLRDGIYNVYEDKGVEGIRERRQDEASIIRLRDDAYRQINKGDVRLRGSGQSGPFRKMFGKGAQMAGAAIGAGTGASTSIPGATEAGAMVGTHYGSKLGRLIAPGDLTRNEMLQRSFKVEGGGVPVTNIEGRPAPATQFGPPQPVSPIMQLYVPQRENTPLHSELATHYGEDVNTGYLDLEKRFKEDIANKKAHGVPLEAPEKALLGKINLADAHDRLKAAEQAQKMAAGQKTPPRATLPDEFDPILHPPQSRLAEGMDTQSGIVHDLAHIVVGAQRGIDFRDGVRSHLHPENVSSGAIMSAPIDWEPFLDKEGNVDPAKLRSKITDIATTYVAGGVANDLYHDIPYTENHHLGADVRILKSFLKNTGFTDAETSKIIAQAADDAAQILSQPGVQDILEKHAAVREQGLDPNYHISPERAELIKLDVKGALDEHPTGNTARPTPERDRSGKADGAGEKAKPEDRNSAELRQAGQGTDKGKTGAMGQAESVSAKPDSEAAGTDRVKESPVIESLKDVLKKGVEKGSYSQDTADDVLNKSRQAEQTRKPKDIVGERPPEFKPIERPAGGWDSETTISPDNPKFDNQDDKYEIPTEPRHFVGDPGPGMKFNKPDHEVLTHELGHALNGLDEGIDTHGVLSHKHPLVSSRAAARMDMDGMLNHENGELRPERVAAYARAAMGGIAADEVFNNRPRSSNINFSMTTPGTDANLTAKALELSGVDPEDIPGMLHQMVDTGKKYLTNPAVSDVIKENLGVREPGLPDSYHYSPTRLRQMYAEAQRRIQNGRLNGTNTGEANTGNSESVPGKQEENPGRTGEEIQATAIAPENPKFGGLNERTTGDPEDDSAIKEAGAIPAGVMFPGTDFQIKMFHDPQTGSTLGFKPGEPVTPELIRQKLAESRQQFGHPQNPQLGPKKEIPYEIKENFVERGDQVANDVLSEYNDALGKPGYRQKWDTVPAGRLSKIWNDYAKNGFVRDESGMDKIADTVLDNIHKLNVNNILTGHSEQNPEEYAESVTGEKVPEGHFEKNENFFDDGDGHWRITDYAMDKLQRGAADLMMAKTPEEKLQAVDHILNIAHQRSDLSKWFVEGGQSTLNKIAGRPSDINPENPQLAEKKEPTHEVYDPKTGEVISQHPSATWARRKVDKLDNAYGGYRYAYRPIADTTPENPQLAAAPPEKKTTGEFDKSIEEGGAIPGGIQKGDPEYGDPDLVLFHDPKTGSTLALKAGDVNPTSVAEELRKSRDKFGIPPSPQLGAAIPQGSKFAEATPEEHRAELDKNSQAATLSDKSAEELRGHKIFKLQTPEGRDTGIQYHITPDGEAGGFVNNGPYKGATPIILNHAAENGATHATAWDVNGKLPNLYERNGLKSTSSEPYDAETYGEPSSQLKAAWRAAGWKDGEPYPSVRHMAFTDRVVSEPPFSLAAKSISSRLVDKFGTTTDPAKAGFILSDGRMVPLNGEHDKMLNQVGANEPKNRENFINNENAIRTRFRVTRGGQEAVYSVPKSGVSPEQIDQLRRSVAALGRYGNAVMEVGEGTGKSTSKEFVRPSDVEPMLQEIGALPKQELALQNPQLGPRGSSVPLMTKPLDIGANNNEDVNTLDVAKALNQFTKKKVGALELGDNDKKMTDRAKRLAEDEAKYQLNQANSGKAWYTTDIAKHDSVLSEIRPELADPAKRSVFKFAEAVLSSGQKPYVNMKSAIKAWDHYNETGEFPPINPDTGKSWGPRQSSAYGNAMDMINRLVREKGEQGTSDWMLSEHPVSELRQYNKDVSGKADSMRPGVMILGEKRGPFAQNLHGIESAFTADMWVSRTWNRWMGTLDTSNPMGDMVSDSPRNDRERNLMRESFEHTAKKLNMSTSALQAVLWYYEQGLYSAHGSKKESWSFADAADRIKRDHDEQQTKPTDFNFGHNEKPEETPYKYEEGKPIPGIEFLKMMGGKK